MTDLLSRPYNPGEKCCMACVFGPTSGPHADWCGKPERDMKASEARHKLLDETEAGIRERTRLANVPLQTLAFILGGITLTRAEFQAAPCIACVTGRDDHAEWCNSHGFLKETKTETKTETDDEKGS